MRALPLLALVPTVLLAAVPLAAASDPEPDPAAAGAKPIPWDQARVADLAGQLAEHCEHLRQAVRKQWGTENLASGQSLAADSLIDDLRVQRAEYTRLAKQVASGKGRDDTFNAFQRVEQKHRDIAEQLRRMFLTEENIERVKKGRAMLDELHLYYSGEADGPPDLVGPKRSDDQKSE